VSPSESRRGVEWLCVRECLRFSRRHPRYFLIFLILYWHSLWHWQDARAARYGFCFLQLYDDIMDGDHVTAIPPDAIADQTIAEWESCQFCDDSSLSKLGAALDAAFKTLPLLPEDDPRRDVMVLLKAMHRDAQRVATRVLLTRAELKTHLRATFHHSVNLLLIASRTQTRAEHVPDLVEALGWCSVVRDLNEDLGKGLVNVPADVVQNIDDSDTKLTPQHPQIRRWLEEERLAALNHLQGSAIALKSISVHDPRATRLLGLFHRSIERYAKKER
jgi:phytoene/squalene synthetase